MGKLLPPTSLLGALAARLAKPLPISCSPFRNVSTLDSTDLWVGTRPRLSQR